jgi:ankyrin repeat protein
MLDDASRSNNTEPTEAAIYRAYPILTDITDQKRFINDQDVLGRSPLHIASQGGLFSAVQRPLELGADPGRSTKYNSTPLHYAAAKGHAHICRVLVENITLNNAYHTTLNSAYLKDHGGLTAMSYALLHGHEEVQKVLAEFQSHHVFSQENVEKAFREALSEQCS